VELNTRGVAEYSDFGPTERYVSETVQSNQITSSQFNSDTTGPYIKKERESRQKEYRQTDRHTHTNLNYNR